MENQKKSRKFLIVGVVAAVVILAALVGLLLTQCGGGSHQANTTGTPEDSTAPLVLNYDLYWNLDRAEYDGKSEAGMSSRQPQSDGYFHIRFLLDGKEVTLKAAERRIVNKIDLENLMGLEIDENGLIVGVLEVDDMPLQVVGYKYFVQSVGGQYIKLNSSENFVGMELMLETTEKTRIYDMSGVDGEVGTVRSGAELTTYDRVIAVQNLEGELTHMFVYSRSNYMKTFQAECRHCQQTVEWGEWTDTETLPTKDGHYQLQNDVQLLKQQSMWTEGQKVCLDLNGKTVEGAKNTRLFSLHSVNSEFALMDTSPEQTGKMVGHSTSSPQGGIVWVRYGAFYMYGGTLDGSDMVSRLNGTVVQVPKTAYFFMYGGTILGGTAEPQYDTANNKYTYGLGGSVQVTGTMRMYGGTITGGKAPAVYYYKDGKLAVSRGMGGNIFLSSGAVMEMTGGEISYGYAGNVGANIMMDGTAEFTMSGGNISGGWTDCKISGKHGASIYCPSKATITMTGGFIEGGLNKTAGGANLYLTGTMTMSGGGIFGGNAKASGGNIQMGGNAKLYLYGGSILNGVSGNGGGNINMSSTASVYMFGGTISGGTAAVNGGNVCGAGSGSFYMYGGTISDGVCNGGNSGNGGGNIGLIANGFVLNISGGTISGGVSNGLVNEKGTLMGGDGGNININKGTVNLTGGVISGGKAMGNGGGVYVGWNSVGLNLSKDAQVYGNEKTDICRSANTAAGKSQITLGAWNGNGSNGPLVLDRVSAKAGSVLAVPASDVTLTEKDAANFTGTRLVLPVVLGGEGSLILSPKVSLGEGDHAHCLCGGSLSHTCADTGFVSVTAAEFAQCWVANGSNFDLAGSLNLCLTEDVTLSTEYRLMGNTLNLCLNGHTVTMTGNARITANGQSGVLNLSDCGSGKILAAENCRSSILYTYKGKMNIYGGTVDASLCAAGAGGAVNVGYAGDQFTLYGGTLIGSTKATYGGVIFTDYVTVINIHGGTVTGGKATNHGGNIHLGAGATMNVTGGLISNGHTTALGGNIYMGKDAALRVSGGTITGGSADGKPSDTAKAGMTGGIYMGYTSKAFDLSGNAQIHSNLGSDVYLGSKESNVISLNGWSGNGSAPALVVEKFNGVAGSVLATGVKAEDEAKFAINGDGLVLGVSGEKLVLKSSFVHDHCLCGGTLDSHSHAAVSYNPVATTQDFLHWFGSDDTLTASVDLVLTGDITLAKEYKLGGHTLNLCLNGHTITMEDKGRLTANGTTGVLNIADCAGGGNITALENCRASLLYTFKGKLTLYGGKVDATLCAAGNGGAVNVGYAGDEFTMYAGLILGSKTAAKGGAVYATGDKTLVNIHGGTISGGSATDLGGNICMNDGVLTMTGGTVTEGQAANGGSGICIEYKADGFHLSGDAAVFGNANYDVRLNSAATNSITLGAWNGNPEGKALTFVKMDGDAKPNAGALAVAFGTELTEEQKQAAMTQFASGAAGFELAKTPEGITLALPQPPEEPEQTHTHCICSGTLTGVEGHTCTDVTFTQVDGVGFLALFGEDRKLDASVSVVLTGDVELAQEYWMDGKTLSLCLNGHTITMKENGRLTSNGTTGVLDITDCGTTGNITAAQDCSSSLLYTYNGKLNFYNGTVNATLCKAGNGGALNIGGGDEVHIYGGTLMGSKKAVQGGTIYAATNGAKLYIHGGLITGGVANKTKATGDGLGGNIHMARGQLILTGGTVTGGSSDGKANANAPAGLTGGIYIPYNGTMTLSGNALVYGNTGSDIYLTSRTDKAVFKLGTWNGNGSNGALVVCKLDAVAGTELIAPESGSLTAGDLQKFVSGAPGTCLELNANGGISLKQAHYHCLCSGALAGKDYHTCKALTFTEVDGEGFLALFGEDRKLDASVSVVLTGDVELAQEYWMDGKTLDLCLNGHTITMKENGRLTPNGTTGVLNITDCGTTGSITALAGCRTGIIYTYNGSASLYAGTLDVKDMVCTKDTYTSYGGAVHVDMASDSFTMYGGTILGGQIVRGGGVYVQNGSFTMYGGTISGGRADRGGNVGLNSGSFAMYGGTITGGSATLSGAGVNVGYSVTSPVTISGNARIYGNTGSADLNLGQNAKKGVNYIILDGWTGYSEQTAMVLSSVNEKADAQIVVSKDGTALSQDVLAKFAYLGGTFALKLSDDGAEILLTK